MEEAADTGRDAREALRSVHASLGAAFEPAGDREAVASYGRAERTHRAVRNGVGVTEVPADAIVLTGADRREYLNNVVTNVVPATDGGGCYALLLDPQGRVVTDMTVYAADERLLAFTPPGVADDVVDGWETFIQDVETRVATDEFAVFGVHGPNAAETVGSVLAGASVPAEPFRFVRGSIGDAGASVARSDAPAGEVGHEVVCAAEAAPAVFDALVNQGTDVVPFGRTTWRALTLEAGTPLFETELDGRVPNVAGVGAAVDYEKGCFVGQEVVSKVRNRGQPSRRLVGLELDGDLDAATDGDGPPAAGATVSVDGNGVGEVTRAVRSPVLESTIALAYVDFGLGDDVDLAVEVGGEALAASVASLPFVDGSERSARIPRYG